MFILLFYYRFQIQCITAPTITSNETIIRNTAPTSPELLLRDTGAFRLWWLDMPVINLLATISPDSYRD
jgi:hypothetical protein